MTYCFVRPDKLVNFVYRRPRRKRIHLDAQSIEQLLNDPMFRAMIELRMKMKRYSQDIENLNNE